MVPAKNLADWVKDLIDPEAREMALLELSKQREKFPELAPYLWNSFGTMAVLLQARQFISISSAPVCCACSGLFASLVVHAARAMPAAQPVPQRHSCEQDARGSVCEVSWRFTCMCGSCVCKQGCNDVNKQRSRACVSAA